MWSVIGEDDDFEVRVIQSLYSVKMIQIVVIIYECSPKKDDLFNILEGFKSKSGEKKNFIPG